MPRVPAYQPQVQGQALGMSQKTSVVSPELQTVGARQQQELGNAGQNLAAGLSELQARQKARDDADTVFKTEAEIRGRAIEYESTLRKSRRADNAKGVTGEADKWWTDTHTNTMGAITDPNQRKLLAKSIERMRLQSVGEFRKFEDHEGDVAHDTNWKASKTLLISQAAANPALAPEAIRQLTAKNAYFAAFKGLSGEAADAENLADSTALHTEIIKQTVTKDPTAAKAYFEANKAEINGKSYDEITKLVDGAVAANDGEKLADKVWGEQGPKGYNDPVALDKMEDAVRKQFPEDATRRKSAISALRERAAAHNASQAEYKASGINAVMDVWTKTKSLAAMQKTPEWQALGGQDRAKIEEHVTNIQTAQLNRGNALEQQSQNALRRQGYGAYLRYSNPEVLATMSENQVQALLPVLGNELTGHLMDKKRAPKAEAEAKVDTESFNAIASRMGLKPFEKSPSEDDKARLGEVKFRMEKLLDDAQRQKKAPLTRQEKDDLLTREIAKTVTTPGWFGFGGTDKPVITLTAQELAKIKVPAADSRQIVQALQAAGITPTDDLIRRYYARNKSAAAALIPNAK